ncbi:MAG: glycosyltransferase family 4 protein, partial [Nanoarchaeota archaeon]|nr:glycosyltransferase family 4 protein [Nanoarchaeota archaeon]
MKKIKVLMASPFVNLKVDTGNKIHQTNIVKHLSDDVWVNWIVQGDYKKKNVKITPVKRKGYGIFSGLSLLLDCFKKVNANAKKCDLVHDRGDLFCIGTFSKLLRKHNKPVVMQVDGDWVNAFVKARKSSVLIKPLMKAWVKKMFQTADVLVPVSKT